MRVLPPIEQCFNEDSFHISDSDEDIYTEDLTYIYADENIYTDKNSCFDSAVDDCEDPKIFVIFHDTQAYPEYLVKFIYEKSKR